MTGVIGFSELALARLEEGDPIRQFVEEAGRSGERATELTQRLLAFGRRQTLRPKPLDLNDVVAGMETLMRRLLGQGIDLVFALEPEPVPLIADRAQLEQVVMNLAINARDAMEGGGRLMIATECEDDDFSTVFGIVHQSGGRIAVESRLRVGTTFSISLPRSEHAPIEVDAPAAQVAPEIGSGSVLVVEDDDAIRDLVRVVLEPAGYDVSLAAGGDEALRAPDPDVLITDILMPGMTGRELAERVLARSPSTRVLFISGYAGEDVQLDDGARFLAKPFTPGELLEQVQALLAP
jgi:two-component system cell cycle sensor histidine kinase/response regulator CckA